MTSGSLRFFSFFSFLFFSISALAQSVPEWEETGDLLQDWSYEYGLCSVWRGNNGLALHEELYGSDDYMGVLEQNLELSSSNEKLAFEVGLTLRAFPSVPAQEGQMPGGTSVDYENGMEFSGWTIKRKEGPVYFAAGHQELTLGRGILLALNERPGIAPSTELKGLGFYHGFPGNFSFLVFGGMIFFDGIDPINNGQLEEEPGDAALGVALYWNPVEVLRLGLLGTVLEPAAIEIDAADERLWIDSGPGIRVAGAGAVLELKLGGLSIDLEADLQRHDNYRVVNDEPILGETGYASVLDVKWDSGFLFRKMKLELGASGLMYRRWLAHGPYRGYSGTGQASATPYHSMPTFQPAFLSLGSLENMVAGRFDASFYIRSIRTQIAPSFVVSKSLGGIDHEGKWTQFENLVAFHPLLGFSKELAADLTLRLGTGYRYETTQEPMQDYDEKGWLVHGEVGLDIQTGKAQTLSFDLSVQKNRLGTSNLDNNYILWTGTLSYAPFENLIFGMTGGFSNEELFAYQSRDNYVDAGFMQGSDLFMNGFVKLEIPLGNNALALEAGGGKQRGGHFCEVGYCRHMPQQVGAFLNMSFLN